MGRNARKIDADNITNLQERGNVMSFGELMTGVKKNADGKYDKRYKDAGSAKMFDAAAAVGLIWPMKLMWYTVGFVFWLVKITIIYPWGNVGLGVLGAFGQLAQYLGWIEPSAEPTAREIALGGSFDWPAFGLCLVLLTVGIIRLVWREVLLRKSLIQNQSEN